jgi:hypothetical protein
MSDLEGVGEAVTGGALARAVEPGAGEAANGHTGESQCLNCGASLHGPYCHECGQRSHVHRTIAAWWHDFLHSVLHVDGKSWLTIGKLVWSPGDLTRRYAHGERARFISPLALFLFTVFFMFAVFSLLGGPFDDSGTAGAQRELAQETASLRERADALSRQRAELAAAGQPTGPVDAELAEAQRELQAVETARNIVLAPNAAPDGQTRLIDISESEKDTGWPWLDSAVHKARQNPDLLLYKLQANAYKFSWALIPISVPFLWGLFLHRRRYRELCTAYDHLVFVTYSIAFMSLWLIAWGLLTKLGLSGGLVSLAMILIPPLHIYRQLKGAYDLSRWSALWRTFALLILATIALMLFGLLLLMVGAFS